MEHLGYLFAAYSIIFVLIGVYAVFIGRRQTSLEREVGKLEAALREAEHAADIPETPAEDS